MVTMQMHHDLAAYKTLPLNGYEKVAVIHAVLIPRSTHMGLFLGSGHYIAQWDDILLQYLKDTPSTEKRTPPPLSFPTPGKTVPHHPLGDGHQVTVPHPPPGGPHYHRTRTFAGTEIAA